MKQRHASSPTRDRAERPADFFRRRASLLQSPAIAMHRLDEERSNCSTVDMSSVEDGQANGDAGAGGDVVDLEIPVPSAHRRSSLSVLSTGKKSKHYGRNLTVLDTPLDEHGIMTSPHSARRKSSFQIFVNATEKRMSQNLALNKKMSHVNQNPCVETAIDFLNKTNMHGFKFIREPHPAQRMFWALACIAAIGFGVYLIAKLVVRWQNEPIMVSLDTSSTPIWDVPFPAITICNMNHVKRSQAEEIRKKLENDVADVDAQIKAALIEDLCGLEMGVDAAIVAKITQNHTYFGDGRLRGIETYLDRLGHSCEDMVRRCTLSGQPVPCSDLFKNVDTDLGRCCAFNVVENAFLHLKTGSNHNSRGSKAHDWDLQEGYRASPPNKTTVNKRELPYRTLASGLSNGISFLLDVQSEEYYCSRYESQGFRVMFHNPTSVPSISDYGFVVSSGNEYFLPVMPSVIHADPAIYHIDPLVRQCFLSNERKLTFFSHYTEENCFTECATNHTYKHCGCVPHFLPHSSSQMVCGPSQVKCAKNVLNGLRENFEVGVVFGCQCMKGCTELEYDKEISHSPIAKLRWQDNVTQLSPLPRESDAAIMHVFFKKENFFKHKRSELFGAIDFFSNVGGLLSLCMGFSALSIVEVVYFFYLRLFCPCGKGVQTVDKY